MIEIFVLYFVFGKKHSEILFHKNLLGNNSKLFKPKLFMTGIIRGFVLHTSLECIAKDFS